MYVVGVADEFSKYVLVKALKSTTTQSVVAIMRQMSGVFGLPLRIVSDRGTAFTSRGFANYCVENEIQHIQDAVRTPRANGQIERVNKTIGTFLRTTTENVKKWDVKLGDLQWAINSQINKTSNCSPHDVIFRYNPRDLLQNRVMAVLSRTDEPDLNMPPLEHIANQIDQKKSRVKRKIRPTSSRT